MCDIDSLSAPAQCPGSLQLLANPRLSRWRSASDRPPLLSVSWLYKALICKPKTLTDPNTQQLSINPLVLHPSFFGLSRRLLTACPGLVCEVCLVALLPTSNFTLTHIASSTDPHYKKNPSKQIAQHTPHSRSLWYSLLPSFSQLRPTFLLGLFPPRMSQSLKLTLF